MKPRKATHDWWPTTTQEPTNNPPEHAQDPYSGIDRSTTLERLADGQIGRAHGQTTLEAIEAELQRQLNQPYIPKAGDFVRHKIYPLQPVCVVIEVETRIDPWGKETILHIESCGTRKRYAVRLDEIIPASPPPPKNPW